MWFVGKVKEGGAWDYKVKTGYKPWNKKWRAIQKKTTSTKTTEWFGNYNYGYTGGVLFSLKTLINVPDILSVLKEHKHDSAQDKQDIKQGFNESPGNKVMA